MTISSVFLILCSWNINQSLTYYTLVYFEFLHICCLCNKTLMLLIWQPHLFFPAPLPLSDFQFVCTACGGLGVDERIILCDISLFCLCSELSCEHCDKLGWGSLSGSVLFWAPARFSDFSCFPGLDPEQKASDLKFESTLKLYLGFNFSTT